MKHTFIFAREEGLHGITAAALLTIDDSRRAEPCRTREDALKLFCGAVTDWLNETEAGETLWQMTVEGFNIGDFMLHGVALRFDFQPYLQKWGIAIDECSQIAWDARVSYDKILNINPPIET
jgi:hypothetical protein